MAAARTAAENNGQEIVILDVRKLTSIFDYFVLVSGRSGRQLRAIADEIDRVLRVEMGDRRRNIEGYAESRWIVLDHGDVVVHLFTEEARAFYRLEDLWADAQRITA
jgi:ribosome-associated protein